jgi:amicyanin
MKKVLFIAAAFLGLATSAGLDRVMAADAAPQTVKVEIKDMKYEPKVLTITAGTTVTWVNVDDMPHTVTDKNRVAFRSAGLDTGDSFTYTFDKPGSFDYFCTIHPYMTGKVVVTAKR